MPQGARNTDAGLSLPYDGITRTGSKGLSQPYRHQYGTPNVILDAATTAHFNNSRAVLMALPQSLFP